ncbi:hypothetical protein B0O99DRAFT_673995 [Bisporella sp. PMI_857]|nr:hypothetical protein B0O99DRAFT_673995 [Bisporella sp. PMI_857]
MYSAASESQETVKLLLDHGADVNTQGGHYGNALQAAAAVSESQETVKLLLDQGADVNAQGGHYGNALQAAVENGKQKTVKLLLDYSANVNAHGGYYGNALQAAIVSGSQEIIKLLLDHSADVNAQSGYYGSALQAAVAHGKQNTVKLLLDHGADVNAQDGHYNNALQAAAAGSGNQETVKLLLDRGTDPKARDDPHRAILQASHRKRPNTTADMLYKSADGLELQSTDTARTVEGTTSEASGTSPENLQKVIHSGKIDDVEQLLNNHFDSVAQGIFAWLQELRQHGYETNKIAQLLVTEQNESPWIYFKPKQFSQAAIIRDHHEPFCVHSGGYAIGHSTAATSEGSRKNNWSSRSPDSDSLVLIQEFCGIAGVIPDAPGLGERLGLVEFIEEDGILAASVTCQLPASEPYHAAEILQALGSLCKAISHAQRSGICCNSFTVLKIKSDFSAEEIIELYQIDVSVVLDLQSELKSLVENHAKYFDLDDLGKAALKYGKCIFQDVTLSSFNISRVSGLLDFYSLETQFLSLAFASYVESHIGAIQPFFLDTPLCVVELYGLEDSETQLLRLEASLCRLTCLNDMIQSPVLVFREGRAQQHNSKESYDLLASLEDLVDTWGPGQFVRSGIETEYQNLTSIIIGGGVIKPTAENNKVLHWSNDFDPRHKFSVSFNSTEKVLIAGAVQPNTACYMDRIARWASFEASLENLGTSADYWQFTEFQAGAAVTGQQFAVAQIGFNKTWTWHAGNSWKRQNLSLIAEELPFSELDRPWGLQDLQTLMKRLIRHILLVLRDTGIDREGKTFLIACPPDHTAGKLISMRLPIPCEKASLWAQILKDSQNCATFAYMTNTCLVTEEHRCQRTNAWHCPSLETAVQHSRLRQDPIILPPQAWDLETNRLYWIGTPDSGLQAMVGITADSPYPRLYISESLVPEKTRARLGSLSRILGQTKDHLQEKQFETWAAKDVLILSPPT